MLKKNYPRLIGSWIYLAVLTPAGCGSGSSMQPPPFHFVQCTCNYFLEIAADFHERAINVGFRTDCGAGGQCIRPQWHWNADVRYSH